MNINLIGCNVHGEKYRRPATKRYEVVDPTTGEKWLMDTCVVCTRRIAPFLGLPLAGAATNGNGTAPHGRSTTKHPHRGYAPPGVDETPMQRKLRKQRERRAGAPRKGVGIGAYTCGCGRDFKRINGLTRHAHAAHHKYTLPK